jgi:hypothetical protein
MSEEKVDDSADEFITFGCWNNGLCSLENPPQNGVSAVMQELNSYVRENDSKVKFIAVSGDNYYPKKEKTDEGTTKYWNENEFNSGFNCFPTNVPVHLLMGNHDLESTQLLDVTNGEKTPLCHIVKEEITKENLTTHQLDLKTNYKLFGNNTFVLFIDTSIYDMDNDDLQCYNTFMKTEFKNVREAQNHQRWRVNSIINTIVRIPGSLIENIVVIGHHPILGVKLKKDREIHEKMNDEGISFFIYLKELLNLSKYKFFYLCADIHNYQHISLQLNIQTDLGEDIKMDIEQYIVGTGGADLDNASLEVDRDINVNGLNLIKRAHINECQIRNGFLICRNVDGELKFHFQPTRFEPVVKVKDKKDKKDKKDNNPNTIVENNKVDDYDPELYPEKFYGGKKRRTQKKRKRKTNKKQKKQKRNNKTTKKRNTRRNRCNHYNMHS